jgi:hypothetical protein
MINNLHIGRIYVSFKKDRKLHKMESRDRVKKIAKCAEESNDLSMMKIIESDDFIERAVYHNGCVTNYLLKWHFLA